MNIVCLLGRLTADPELRTTQTGTPVTSFSLAVDRAYQKERQVDFINIVVWRETASFVCRNFRKGQRMGLQGALQARKYTDRNNAERTVYEVIANNVYFADSKNGENAQAGGVTKPPEPQQPDYVDIIVDDDLPF